MTRIQKIKLFHVFLIYLILILSISMYDLFVKVKYNNYLIFYYSAEHFLQKKNLFVLYSKQYFDLFKYSPLFPLFMIPFITLPIKFGAIIWNLINSFCVFYGITIQKLSKLQKISCLLIILPEVVTNAHNFQSNGLIVGGALFSFYLFAQKRYYLANLVLQFLLIIKVYGFFFVYQFLFLKRKEILKQIGFFCLVIFSLFGVSILLTNYSYIKDQFYSFYHLLEYESTGYGVSIMGVLNLFFNRINTHFVQFIGLCAFLLLLGLIWRKHPTIQDKYDLFILSLVLIIIFNHRSEYPTMIIASTGIGLYLVLYRQGRILKDWVFWMKMILCSLVYTDILPKGIKRAYVYPYHVKVWPFIVFFIYFYIVVLLKSRKGNEQRSIK